jgi:hypothetical protein
MYGDLSCDWLGRWDRFDPTVCGGFAGSGQGRTGLARSCSRWSLRIESPSGELNSK